MQLCDNLRENIFELDDLNWKALKKKVEKFDSACGMNQEVNKRDKLFWMDAGEMEKGKEKPRREKKTILCFCCKK